MMYQTDMENMRRYSDLMNGIKELNKKIRSEEMNNGRKQKRWMLQKRPSAPIENANRKGDDVNYFLDKKIAVYTCILGNYDNLLEPLFVPDNCDFFVITDQKIAQDSKWNKIDPAKYLDFNHISSPIEMNRYFKMKPQVCFSEYNYSVYVDGNFQIYTDLTEHINKISTQYGIGVFAHAKRNCIYAEAAKCVELNKIDRQTKKKIITYMKQNQMPEDYGLLYCGMIARNHKNETGIKIMDEWWEEFKKFPFRDQIILPYVLYRNKIKTQDLSTLGPDYEQDYSIQRIPHVQGG